MLSGWHRGWLLGCNPVTKVPDPSNSRSAPDDTYHQCKVRHLFLAPNLRPIFPNRIEQDDSAETDEHGDHRRIVHLFMTSADKRPPIHFSHPRIADRGEEGDT